MTSIDNDQRRLEWNKQSRTEELASPADKGNINTFRLFRQDTEKLIVQSIWDRSKKEI